MLTGISPEISQSVDELRGMGIKTVRVTVNRKYAERAEVKKSFDQVLQFTEDGVFPLTAINPR